MTFLRYKTQEARRKTDFRSFGSTLWSDGLCQLGKPAIYNTITPFLFSFLFLLFSTAQGQQTYPVRSTIAVRYPSVFLDEYADITNTTASVTLLDLQKTNYKVLVKLSMESADIKLVSKEPIPLVISGGVPVELDFSDPNIAKLFAFDNLIPEKGKIGEFNDTKVLFEGLYLVKLEVYDANFPTINVSNVNTNITTVLVQRFDPPLLNLPANNSSIQQDPFSMNLFFSWTPRSVTASPNIRILYQIKMVEVPDGKNPYDAINIAGRLYPITMLADSGLTFPSFSFTPDQFALTQGRTYAWQVLAYEEDQITGGRRYQRFRHQGKSEVFTFTVKENCGQIDVSSIQTQTTGDAVNITWSKEAGHTEYELNYREMGSIYQYTPVRVKVVDDNSDKQTVSIDINSLEKGIQYEFKIAAKCMSWQPEVYGGLFKVQKQDCSAPTPIKIESTPTEVKLSWDPTDNSQKYRLRYKGGNNALENEVIVDVTSTTTQLPALQQGKTYQIIVDAVCNSGTLDLGKTYTIHANETGYAGGCPIPQPFKLIVDHTPGQAQTSFKWSYTDGLHKSYKFYVVKKDLYDIAPSTVAWAEAAVAMPQINIDTLTEDRLYAYKIDYVCDNGQVSTTPVGFFKLEKEPIVPVNPGTGNCFPPATSAAEGVDVDAASFEWSKSEDAEEYQLFYAPKGSNDFKVFNTTQKNTTLEDLDITKTHIYKYKIRARCANAKYSLFTDTALVDLDKRYTGDCIYTGIFRSDNQAANEIRLTWKHMDNTAYVISYREESQKVSPMYTTQINADTVNKYKDGDSLRFTIKNLDPKTNYVFYLQPVCGTEQGKRVGPLNVATKESASNGDCGDGKVLCDSKSQVPLANGQLVPIKKQGTGTGAYYEYDKAPESSIFKAADIEIITTENISYNATTKTYTGTGVAKMELDLGDAGKALNGGGSSDVNLTDRVKTSVKFTNVTINDARCLIKGNVEVTGIELNVLSDEQKAKLNQFVDKYNQILQQLIDAGKKLSEALDLAKLYTEQAENYLDGGQKYGNVKTGSIVPVPANADYSVSGSTVKDKSGNTIATIVSPAPTLTAKDTILCQKCGTYVSFSNGPSAAYDFDEYKDEYFTHRKVAREYKALRYQGGKYYFVSAKALVEGKVDKVKANLNGYSAADLSFKSSAGVTYNFNASDQTLSIPGGEAGDGQHIFVYSKSKGDSLVGRLLVANYPSITKKVVFVTVGDPTKWKNKPGFSVQDVKTKVETLFAESYNKVGIKYEIELDDITLKTDDSWDSEPKDGMVQDSKSGFLDNNFTGEEKALVTLYQKLLENMDSTKSYLFFTPDGKLATGDLQGKMPRGKRSGYIFMQGSSLNTVAKTVLHELGHGPHSLAHIFNSDWLDKDANKSNGMNLTAYGDGTDLIKHQWDIMHDPGVVLGFFEDDEDAEGKSKVEDCSYTNLVNDVTKTKLAKIAIISSEDKTNQSDILLYSDLKHYSKKIQKVLCAITYTKGHDSLTSFINESINKTVCNSSNSIFIIRELNGTNTSYRIRTSKNIEILPLIKEAIVETPNIKVKICGEKADSLRKHTENILKSVVVAFDNSIKDAIMTSGRILVNNPCYIRGHLNLRWYMPYHTFDIYPVPKRLNDKSNIYIYNIYSGDKSYTGLDSMVSLITKKNIYHHTSLPVSKWDWQKSGKCQFGCWINNKVGGFSKELVWTQKSSDTVKRDLNLHRLEVKKVFIDHGESMNTVGFLSYHGWEATYCNYFAFDLEERIFARHLFKRKAGCSEMFSKLFGDSDFKTEWKEINMKLDEDAIFKYAEAGYLVHIWLSSHISTPCPDDTKTFIQSGSKVGYNIDAGYSGYRTENIKNGKVRGFVFVGNIKKGSQYLATTNILMHSESDKYNTLEDIGDIVGNDNGSDYDTQY